MKTYTLKPLTGKADFRLGVSDLKKMGAEFNPETKEWTLKTDKYIRTVSTKNGTQIYATRIIIVNIEEEVEAEEETTEEEVKMESKTTQDMNTEQLIEDITERNQEAWVGQDGGTAAEYIAWWREEGYITGGQAAELTRCYQDDIQEIINALAS